MKIIDIISKTDLLLFRKILQIFQKRVSGIINHVLDTAKFSRGEHWGHHHTHSFPFFVFSGKQKPFKDWILSFDFLIRKTNDKLPLKTGIGTINIPFY